MSLDDSMTEIDDSCRKRRIEEVADAEAPPYPSRLRVSPKQEVEAGDPSGRSQDNYQYHSEAESKFTSAGDEDSDNGDTRDSSYEHDGDGDLNHTLIKQEDDGLHPASRAIPQSWEEASNADRILVRMKSKGLSWDEIAKAWKEKTAQETTYIVLLNRYNRLMNNVQFPREGDSERLLAAVEEVKAEFEREKWRLVKNAMIRAGAAEYSMGFIQKQYKKLARGSQKTNATGSHTDKKIEDSKGVGSMKVSHVADRTTGAASAPITPVDPSLARTDPLAYKAKVSVGTPSGTTSTAQKSKEPGAAKVGAQTKGTTEAPNTVEKESAKGQLSAKPGSLAMNAILLDDTGLVIPPVHRADDPVTSALKALAKSAAPGSGSNADTPAVIPRPGPSLGITSSRVGSATNRGPARFKSLHRATDDDATRKQRNALNSSPDPTKIEPGKAPVDALRGDSENSVSKGTLQCTNFQQRVATQQNLSAENGSPQMQQAPLGLPAQPVPASTNESNSTQHSITPPHNPHGLPIGEASTRPRPYHKPSDIQAPLQREGTRQQSPIQSIEVASQLIAVPPEYAIDPLSPHEGSSGRFKKAVTTDQIKHMLRYRTLNDVNWSKNWDVIAQECGVIATLADISVALEQAGFRSILNASEPLRPTDDAGSAPLTAPNTNVSLARAFATPPPATIPSQDGTPTTGSRRGRPRGSKNKPKYQVRGDEPSMSPSQTKTPVSGQKGHFKSAETKAAQSTAMKAAWKRRKEKGMDWRKGGAAEPSTTAAQPFVDSLTATFAADILAAAAANTKSAPALEPQSTRASALPTSPDSIDDEAVDLLTGESMFAQHYDDPPPAHFPGPPPAKKIVRRSIISRPI